MKFLVIYRCVNNNLSYTSVDAKDVQECVANFIAAFNTLTPLVVYPITKGYSVNLQPGFTLAEHTYK